MFFAKEINKVQYSTLFFVGEGYKKIPYAKRYELVLLGS
jgi:hypothetical protein